MRSPALALLLAASVLPAAADEAPAGVPPEIRAAVLAADAGRKCAALARLDAWLATHPGDAGGHVLRGDALLDCLRGPAAVEDYRAALRARPGDAYAWGQLLEALLFSNRYREAAALLERWGRQAPSSAPPPGVLAQVRARADELRRLARRSLVFRALAALAAATWSIVLLLLGRWLSRSPRPSA